MGCTTTKKVIQGNTLGLTAGFVDGSVISGDWVCYLQVTHKPTRVITAINRQVTTKNIEGTKFVTSLSAAESSALSKGVYVVGIELENTVSGEVIENTLEIEITEQWVIR